MLHSQRYLQLFHCMQAVRTQAYTLPHTHMHRAAEPTHMFVKLHVETVILNNFFTCFVRHHTCVMVFRKLKRVDIARTQMLYLGEIILARRLDADVVFCILSSMNVGAIMSVSQVQ